MMTLEQRTDGMLLGAFVGDALALGPHWVYDRKQIMEKLGRVTGYREPATQYHPGKRAGDYTHLGDQMLVLHRSLAASGGKLEPVAFMKSWLAFWNDPATKSYQDKATKAVWGNVEQGAALTEAASASTEFAGPVRGFPVLAAGLRRGDDEAALANALVTQTSLTHRSPEVMDVAVFTARLVARLKAGQDSHTALEEVIEVSSAFVRDNSRRAEAQDIAGLSTGEAIESLGQSCDSEDALPASVLLLRRHGGSFEEALVENVMAGGDSAARGIFVGGVLGFVHGEDGIPKAWRDGLRQRPVG